MGNVGIGGKIMDLKSKKKVLWKNMSLNKTDDLNDKKQFDQYQCFKLKTAVYLF